MVKYDKVVIKRSTNPKKKLMAVFSKKGSNRTKATHLGAAGMSDYTKHRDKERRQRYLDRHRANENWNNPTSAGSLSRYILWNKETRASSISDYKNRFGFK